MKTLIRQLVDPWPPVLVDAASAAFLGEGASALGTAFAADGVPSHGAGRKVAGDKRIADMARTAGGAGAVRPATTKRLRATGRRNPITDTGTNRPPLIPPERSSP